ncbi:hypothetical protein B0H13DRAFT_2381763 [Mycena leptocephala]|nr:hypothetical protein B0H13DRAFT_2381763 [Mycena leptocephala]
MNEYRNIRRDIADTAARGVLIEDRLRVLGVVEQSLNPADLSAQLRRAEQNLKEERRQLKISEGILQDVQRECKAPGTRQFMSARLSSATEPQTRGLADDLESFLLRADELQVFDDANPAAKRSPHFEHLLGKLLDGFEARYRVRLRLDPGPPISTVHLESHGWMLEMLRQALEDETWGALQSKLS